MYLAMTMDGENLESNISQRFEECNYLLVVNTDDLSVNVIENKEDITAVKLAQNVIDFNCEGIITGVFSNLEAFDILADACITRYLGSGYSGMKTLDLMKKRELKLIKNINGTDQCDGNHHHSSNE
ncbi:hypothetical protein GH810_01605 [Acetobacterium paludosum]|uniref:Dinitrogenase iron-molybdenum cofactor biosynthesis domain-containing protein n=1 Tax=Acetobacterium paludosum TaxID=52693 RepID=A0A923HRE9_9FIRM|nr:hypothetical protein [Acetobacterium paludosum]MBC3887011.1 hypothetical protein [Acetobacterium paludosum]